MAMEVGFPVDGFAEMVRLRLDDVVLKWVFLVLFALLLVSVNAGGWR